MEVDLGPGYIVLDGIPAPPSFRPMSIVAMVAHLSYCWALVGPCVLWTNSRLDQDAILYEGRPQPRRDCVRWGLNSPPKRRHSPPNFRPMCIVAKMAGLIKMPLGMERGHGPGEIG